MDQAATELSKAVQLNPQDAGAHYYFAKTLAIQSKNAEAIQELQKVGKLKPDWFEVQVELGIVCQRAGDTDCAVAAFEQAGKVQPQNAEAYNDLGLALVQKREAEASIPKFRMAGAA